MGAVRKNTTGSLRPPFHSTTATGWQVSPASVDGLEHAKPRASPIENGVLDGPQDMQGEERNEEMARDVVHPFHQLVHVPVRSHRGRNAESEHAELSPERPGQEVAGDHHDDDRDQQSPVHEPRREVEDGRLLRWMGAAPADPVPHAPQQEHSRDRPPLT